MRPDADIVKGSDNVFRDLGRGAATGVAAADFSRIRNARLDQQVNVRVSVRASANIARA